MFVSFNARLKLLLKEL